MQTPGPATVEEIGLREQIEKRAYALWQVGGCRHGNDVDDWLQAEREVLAQSAGTSGERVGAHEANPPKGTQV